MFDEKTKETLSKVIDFELGTRTAFSTGSDIPGFSIWQWIYGGRCVSDKKEGNSTRKFNEYFKQLLIIKENVIKRVGVI